MYKVIGISGYKGAGKDYFAKFYKENTQGEIEVVHFAHRLKEICAAVYGHDIKEYYDLAKKERKYETYIHLDKKLSKLRDISGLPNIEPHGVVAESHRHVLQYIGTEYIRNASPNYWIDYIIGIIKSKPNTTFLVPDTRFTNEVKVIKELGGICVMVHRPEVISASDGHASENLDGIKNDMNLHIVSRIGDGNPLNTATKIINTLPNLNKMVIKVSSEGMEEHGI